MKKYTTNKLSDPDIKHAKPKDRLYRLRDGGGLSCDVLTTGKRIWRYAYRIHGKQKTFTIGEYKKATSDKDHVGLSDARTKRDEAKAKVKAGIDPSLHKQIRKKSLQENNFQLIANKMLEERREGWSVSHYSRFKRCLEKDANPLIGKREISSIEALDIIAVVKKISERGSIDVARRTKGFIQQVFDYAVVHGKASRNPAKDINLGLILPKTVKKHYASIKDPLLLGELLRTIDEYHGTIQVRSALKIFPLVMVRPTELTSAPWSEFDLEKCIWTIPAKRRKLPTHIKVTNKPEDAHIVPYCSQMLDILKELHQYTGNGKYLFPSVRSRARPISNDTIRTALRTMGFDNDTITTHGFRGTASTFLNTLGYRSDVIEAQLSHKDKNEIRSAYNHADYMDERKIMLQDWANYLDSLRQGADVIPINRRQA